MKKIKIICMLIVLLWIITGCAAGSDPTQTTNPQNELGEDVELYYMESDWPWYASLGELLSSMKYVIIGKAEEQLPYEEHDYSIGVKNAMPTVETPFRVSVVKSIYGEIKESHIKIIQSGGLSSDGKRFYSSTNEPLLEVGKEYLMFMIGGNGRYGLAPPRVGYIEIQDGKLNFEEKENLFGTEDLAEALELLEKTIFEIENPVKMDE